ncbi:O-methyltransferase, family 3 [Ophiocordyceps camponoti-floridani]|uniref:O-methyltransferase, family 3 n=1 Tax=Ophiocordyceps camponoti-floridani TaxID=2030778 RepID=A0A8H4Q3F6_9HYPO|nr:O-methyltransferase, family 3 [Ophiocordyceps camponoti-floridani]
MKAGEASNLYRSPETGNKVLTYAESHSTALDAKLTAFHAQSAQQRPDSRMLSSNSQSQFHRFLVGVLGAKRVLEIGVYVGYSAMAWALAVGGEGFVTGLEYSAELADIARQAMKDHQINNVEIIVGDAATTLTSLRPKDPYDMVFIDADKEGYMTYLTTLLDKSPPSSTTGRLLRPGALIIADNVLRSGFVADESLPLEGEGRSEENWRSHIKAIREFNDACLRNERLEMVMLPLWDGVSLLRLKD